MQINLLFGTPCINLFLAPTGVQGVVFLPATAYYAQHAENIEKLHKKSLKESLKESMTVALIILAIP